MNFKEEQEQEEDEVAAIYLYYLNCRFNVNVILDSKNLKHIWHCKDCKCVFTPQKRNNRCNACGILFSKQRFCSYCDRTYRISYEKDKLLQCTKCGKRVHFSCEKEFDEGHITKDNKLYFCCDCYYE